LAKPVLIQRKGKPNEVRSQAELVGTKLSIERIDRLEALGPLENDWTRLVEESDFRNFFSTFDFVSTWWKHLSYGNTLSILIFKDDGKVVGIAPLMISNVKWFIFKARKVSFPVGRFFAFDFIIEQGRREECIRLLINYIWEKLNCHYIEFSGLPAESPTIKILNNISKDLRMSFHIEKHSRGCFLPIQGTWDDFIREKSDKLRRTCREKMNRLRREGEYRIVRVKRASNLSQVEQQLIDIDTKSWKTASITKKEHIGFLREIVEICDRKGWLDLSFLELKETPIAYWFNIRYQDKAYALFTTYNDDYAALSPGLILLYHVINQLYSDRERIRELDFLTNLQYIQKWTKLERSRMIVTLYRKSLTSQLVHFGRLLIHITRRLQRSL
jgi:CelD/BcsL family acetyltransferase involved in cellulose biosynthesis